jgi:hypothetical protein
MVPKAKVLGAVLKMAAADCTAFGTVPCAPRGIYGLTIKGEHWTAGIQTLCRTYGLRHSKATGSNALSR